MHQVGGNKTTVYTRALRPPLTNEYFMQAILVSDEELAQLRALVPKQVESLRGVLLALEHPVPDLAGFLFDIEEIVSRARDGSSYINEDFPEFLEALEQSRVAYAKGMAARKALASIAGAIVAEGANHG
jgi:hypothetical protein